MGGGTQTSNPNTDILGQLSKSLFDITSPVTRGVAGTVQEGLKTGGIGMLMPLISNAISSAKSALSGALTNNYYGSTLFGGARSPFTQANLQKAQSEGNVGISQIGPGMTMNWLSTMIPALFGQQNSALGGLSAASQSSSSMVGSANSAFGQMMAAALGGVSQGVGDLGGAAIAKCWVAETLYGLFDRRTALLRRWTRAPATCLWERVWKWSYSRWSQPWSRIIRRYKLQRVVRPWFEYLLIRAQRSRV